MPINQFKRFCKKPAAPKYSCFAIGTKFSNDRKAPLAVNELFNNRRWHFSIPPGILCKISRPITSPCWSGSVAKITSSAAVMACLIRLKPARARASLIRALNFCGTIGNCS